MYRRRYHSPFSRRRPTIPITVTQVIQKKRGRCKGCGSFIEPGETAVRLRLRMAHRGPCATCGTKPVGAKRYHERCQPTDPNTAMNFDPNRATGPAASPDTCKTAPPPKPPSPEDAALGAIAALENALLLKAAREPITAELEAQFKKYQGIKAHVLRPGNDNEQRVAVRAALIHAVKLVF